MGKTEIVDHLLVQDSYLDILEAKALDGQNDNFELACLRESEEKMKQQQLEATRRENVLVMRLTTKEQEMQEYANQIQELKQAQIPGMTQLRSTLLDPAVNLMFERMKKELDATKAKLEETQNDLSAWKFTPDSNTGKRLMAKCRLLHQENEDLGKMISSGRVAKLEADLALQRTFTEELKKSQSEIEEFLLEMDEDVEGLLTTIYQLQQQLREAKEVTKKLQQENDLLRNSKDYSSIKLEGTTNTDEHSNNNDASLTTSIVSHDSSVLEVKNVKDEPKSPISELTNSDFKDKFINDSSVKFDKKSTEKENVTTYTLESDTNLRTSSNSAPISEETSLDNDVDMGDKTELHTERNGDDINSPYPSEPSCSPCTPVIKSPLCKEHSNGDTVDDNVSEYSNSMDACSNNYSNSVQSDSSEVRHWSSVNGVSHDKNSGE
ncbi:hypothetical protein CHUAL_007810 [Chamberlinius hualienensis]